MDLTGLHQSQGAELAGDAIPLRYGDLHSEYHAALQQAALMDRSHEGRIALTGRDRLDVPHRISTNALLDMATGEGRPTIFINPNARILDRVLAYNRGESLLMVGEPGRGTALLAYLRRNIFFNDQLVLTDLAASTRQFALHGPLADTILESLIPGCAALPALGSMEAVIAGVPVFVGRRKPVSEAHWVIIAPEDGAADVWMAIYDAGQPFGLRPAGSLTYNTLRIRAGRPAAGHELSLDFIPLEIGLWDEVSFTKGCYTGQEIIARMESRSKLAKMMVRLKLSAFVEAPANLTHDGKPAGTLTSSVQSADDEVFAIGVVKSPFARPQQTLTIGDQTAVVIDIAGTQPANLLIGAVSEE